MSDWRVDDGTLLAGIVAFITGIGVPVTRKARKAARERRMDRLYESGVKGVPGLIPEVLPAKERTAMLERDLKQAKRDIGEIKTQVISLVEGQDEIKATLKLLFPNGKNTNNPGDLLARQAIQNGTWLEEDEPHS